MKIPVRVSDVVRSLVGSGVMATVAFFFNRTGCLIYSGQHLSSARRFPQHFGLNCMGIGAADLGKGRLTDFHVSGFMIETIGLKGD